MERHGDDPSASEDEDAAIGARDADDDAFIDDDGAEPAPDREDGGGGGGGDSDGEDDVVVEDAAFDAMFDAKASRRGAADPSAADAAAVQAFVARMEVAAEADAAAAAAGRPAVERLRLLPAVRSTLAAAKTAGLFLDSGVLRVLRSWLAPSGPGRLPPVALRAGVLAALATLPIDVADDVRKHQLKESGVGAAVSFCARLAAETPANRRAARALVERWSRPVFDAHADQAADLEARRARERDALAVRAARAAATAAAPASAAPERRRALPPRAPRLDYVMRPASEAAAPQGGAGGSKSGGVEGKLRALARRNKAGAPRAARPSVEGKGLQ